MWQTKKVLSIAVSLTLLATGDIVLAQQLLRHSDI
jgi:hypothetical protein